MKQTAVEWLMEIQNSQKGMLFECDINQAKEMEKQQIIDAIVSSNKSNNRNVSLNPEQYYNETFKKK
jgi:hypothetical protein